MIIQKHKLDLTNLIHKNDGEDLAECTREPGVVPKNDCTA